MPGIYHAPGPIKKPVPAVTPYDTLVPEDQAAPQATPFDTLTASDTPPPRDPAQGTDNPVVNLARGFNKEFANLVGLPIGAVDEALGWVGMDSFDNGTKAQESVRKLFDRLGLNTQAEGLMADIGGSTFQSAVIISGLAAASGPLVAREGPRVMDQIIRGIGEVGKNIIATKPVVTLGLEAVANPAAVIGEKIGGPLGAVGSAAVAPFAAAKIVRGGKSMVEGTQRFWETRGKELPMPVQPGEPKRSLTNPAPIFDPDAPLPPVKAFAAEQVEGDLKIAKQSIRTAINNVPRTMTATDQSTAFRVQLVKAKKVADRLAGKLWDKVPGVEVATAPVLRDIQQFAIVLRKEMTADGTDTGFPKGFVEKLENFVRGTKPIVNDKGQIVRNGRPFTVRQMIKMRSDILKTIRDSEKIGATALSETMERNLNRIQSVLMDSIQKIIPDDIAFKQARTFSTEKADLFSKGPVGAILRNKGKAVLPGQTVKKLLAEWGTAGADAVQKVADAPFLQRRGRGVALSMDFENTVRAQFREAAGEGPEAAAAAQKFIDKNLPRLRTMSDISYDLTRASAEIENGLHDIEVIEKSYLAQFIKHDPKDAIAQIYHSADPLKDIDTLIKSFDGNELPLRGLRTAMEAELLRRTKGDPLRLQEILKPGAPIRRTFERLLPKDDMARVLRIVELSARTMETTIGAAGRKPVGFGVKRKLLGTGTIILRVIGAWSGHEINRVGPGGNIQVPQIFSNLGRALAEKWWSVIDPELLLRRAIQSAEWERLLYRKVPSTPTELTQLRQDMRRLIGQMEAAKQIYFDVQSGPVDGEPD